MPSTREWIPVLRPDSVNTMYAYSLNQIYIPLGIIQPPFYDEDQPTSLNFGQMGVLIGHEVNSFYLQMFKSIKGKH